MARIRIHPPLLVDELMVREYCMDDLEQLDAAIVRNREYLLPWIGPWIKAEPIGLEARRVLLQGWVDRYSSGLDNPVGIFIHDALVGSAGLHDRNQPDDLEIGYWVDEAHQGRGIASRVARTLCDHAFSEPSVRRLLLVHNVDNAGSRRVAEKLGMSQLPGPHDCGDSPGVLWELTRDAWWMRRQAASVGATLRGSPLDGSEALPVPVCSEHEPGHHG